MTYKVTFNKTTKIIESRINQDFDWNLVEHIAPEICKHVINQNSELLFFDLRKSKISMSTIKIYETPRKIGEEFAKSGVNIREMKRAVLINPDQKDFDFLDSVTANNAQILKLFYDEESAMKWLTTLGSLKG